MAKMKSDLVLDYDKIGEAISRQGLPAKSTDFAWYSACYLLDKYAEKDCESARIAGAEIRFEEEVDFYPGKFVWVCDVISANPALIVLDDWKCVRNPDTEWRRREKDSLQWKLYSYFVRRRYCPDYIKFRYRGVARGGGPPSELVFDSSKSYFSGQLAKAYDTLAFWGEALEGFSKEERWPAFGGSACYAFRRTCPHYDDCTLERLKCGKLELEHLSYSTLTKLISCPERVRADKLFQIEETSPELQVGKAMHEGMAEAYKQIRDFQISTGFNTGVELDLPPQAEKDSNDEDTSIE